MIALKNYNQLKKNLKLSVTDFPKIKVAIIGDNATQFITTALKGYGVEKEVAIETYEADYDMMDQEIFNLSSDLYSFNPEFIILIPSTEKLLNQFYKEEDKVQFYKNTAKSYGEKYTIIKEKLNSKIILFNFPEINDSVFGHFANKVSFSFPFQLRKLNTELMELAVDSNDLFVFDMSSLQSQYGWNSRFNPKLYINAKIVFSPDFIPLIAKELTDIIFAIKGMKLHKCLILDLDNTTWGGVIGDDGMEGIQIGSLGIGRAFTELQKWAKELKRRGIILCVCSKNTESIAKEPFEKHPEMVLRLEDISVFVANWENKADNIRHIKRVLNIGYDSMVFLDDNPFERNLVREELPAITVPELPVDPSEYLGYIRSLNLFETSSFSREDTKRTKRYQAEAQRVATKKSFKSIDTYLESLQMRANINPFTAFSTPRIAQLTQRSNQFNLRTIRYSEEDINRIRMDNSYITLQVELEDKYGEYGLISVIIGKKQGKDLFIDTWLMSCRVLKRNIETFVLNELIYIGKQEGIQKIIGEYLPTSKNIIVENHYKNLGFQSKNKRWILNVEVVAPHRTIYIKKVEKDIIT